MNLTNKRKSSIPSVIVPLHVFASITMVSIEAFQPLSSSSIITTNPLITTNKRRSSNINNNINNVHYFQPNKRQSSQTSLHAFDLTNSNILSNIETFYQTAPYTSAFVTCGIKASFADLFAQFRSFENTNDNDNDNDKDDKQKTLLSTTTIQTTSSSENVQMTLLNENKVEFQRNLAFILYGGLYQGIAQEYIYNFLFPSWFGTGNDIITVLTKVSFDLIIISPLICIPIAYIVKALIYGNSWKEGLEKYSYDLRYKNLLVTYYSIWFPAGLCTFGIIPDHLRIAFIAFVSFFWLIILSTISSSSTSCCSNEDQ